MQMDAESNKEQIGTRFVWVGALEGGVGGGWSLRGGPSEGSTPKSGHAFQIQKTPSCVYPNYWVSQGVLGRYGLLLYVSLFGCKLEGPCKGTTKNSR